MTTLRTAAQQALETLDALWQRGVWGDFHGVADNLRAALAEPVQEPVAAWENKYGMKEWEVHALRAGWMPAPPQRLPLTEEALSKIIDAEIGFNSCVGWEEDFARAIERAHGIT